MQSQMIGMQSSLDRILAALQTQAHSNVAMSPQGQLNPFIHIFQLILVPQVPISLPLETDLSWVPMAINAVCHLRLILPIRYDRFYPESILAHQSSYTDNRVLNTDLTLSYRVPPLHPMTRLRKLPELPSTRPLKLSRTWLTPQLKRQQSPRLLLPGMSAIFSSDLFLTFLFLIRPRKRRRAEIPRNAFPHVVEKVCLFFCVPYLKGLTCASGTGV